MGYSFPQQKLTRKQKAKNNFAWGKNVLDEIDKYNSKGFDCFREFHMIHWLDNEKKIDETS